MQMIFNSGDQLCIFDDLYKLWFPLHTHYEFGNLTSLQDGAHVLN